MRHPTTFARIFLFVLTRRYRIRIKGEELLKSPGAKLILPNHQSHIDPQLMAAVIAQHSDFVPVISESFVNIPLIGNVIRKWNPVTVRDPRDGKKDPNALKRIFSQVTDALKRGKSVVIYPSGKISHTPIEKIHNRQGAHVIVSGLPQNTRVIGVRISGLWGSMWSVAWMGERPDFARTFLKGILYFFANLIFFSPGRDVTLEFVDITEDAKLKSLSGRSVFNSYLEDFFNVNGPEQATYIKHIFYFPESEREYPGKLED